MEPNVRDTQLPGVALGSGAQPSAPAVLLFCGVLPWIGTEAMANSQHHITAETVEHCSRPL